MGLLKPKITSRKPQNVDELKETIRHEFENFDRSCLKAINERTFRRLHLCIEHEGHQVDPFDM